MSQNTNKGANSRFRRIFAAYASEFSIGIALLLLCIVLSILSPYFLKMRNFMNVLSYVSISGVMSAGLTVVMLMGCMDLSQYSVMAMIGMYLGIMLEHGVNPYVTIVCALVFGAAAGCINAFMVTKMQVPPMIATIGSQLVARSVAYLSTNGSYLMINNPVYYTIGNDSLLGIPYLVWVLLIVYAVVIYMLNSTAFGRKIFAVGGNAQACALSGISVDKMKTVGYIISGLCAGLAAVLCTSQVSAAYPTAGSGQEMDCSAAVYLGGLAVGGGKGSAIGTFIGVTMIAVLLNGMTLLGVNPYYQVMLKGLVLVLAIYIDRVRAMRSAK